jgi:ABC-type Fe3+ transport system substrate-binding protein
MGGLNPAIPTLIPTGTIQPLKPMLFFPEVIDTKGWFKNQLHWFDSRKESVLGFRGNASKADLTYNTKKVDPKEIQSYFDLLKPKWKGKIIMRDPRTVGVSGSTAFFYLSLGGEWLRRLLTEMDVTVTRSARQAGEKLALGKYAFCLFACGNEVRRLKREGHPVENAFPHYLKEASRISPGGGALYVLDRPPHPNAQKFFANWWLTRAGQNMMQEGSGDQSLRDDLPLDKVFPDNRREKGRKYLMMGSQRDYQELLAQAMSVTRKALASVGK